jgi:hypothetical protein
MARTLQRLHELQMASPCSAGWDEMKGTDRVRRCHKCRLLVYRVSDLTREEAEEVVEAYEGHACRHLYRRHDGTVLMQDCPKGVAAARKASRWWKERMFHLFLLLLPWMILTGFIHLDSQLEESGNYRSSIWDIEPFRTLDRLGGSGTTPTGTIAPPMATPVWVGQPPGIWEPIDGGPIDPEMLPPGADMPGRPNQDPPP